MLEKIKGWFQSWKGYLGLFAAFLVWLIAYTLWTMYGRRNGQEPPTLDAEIQRRAAEQDVRAEQQRQQAELDARLKREQAARFVRDEIERRNKQIDETAKNGTDAELARELEKELNRKP